jgi:hypothetical protein
VLRWLESLHSRQDLLVLGQLLTQAKLQTTEGPDFAAQVEAAVSVERTQHLCQLGLQSGLAMFLYRRRVLSKKRVIPTLCLCVLRLICWQMTHTCVHELLSGALWPAAPRTKAFALKDTRHEATASFLNALFVARYGASCLVSLIFGRAYQVFFCEPWPTRWKRVPAYLGSKNLVLGTLFFAAAGVSAMSVSARPLRSLCEAATHIEALALVIAFGHFVFLHFQSQDEEVSTHSVKAAD